MSGLRCTVCDKKLSRKTARVIDGKPLCSSCMFNGPWPIKRMSRDEIAELYPKPPA